MSKKTITISIDPEVQEQGKKRAKEESRSLSAYIEFLIKEDVKKTAKS